MSLVFYSYEVPESSPLSYDYGMDSVFIAYNPVDGETAFFEVVCDAVKPFDAAAMGYVWRRWKEYTEGKGYTPGTFDVSAHDDFMRGL